MSTDVVWTVNGNESVPSRPQAKPEKWRPSSFSSIVAGSSSTSDNGAKIWTSKKSANVSKYECNKKASSGTGNSWTKSVEICAFDYSSSSIKKTFNLPLTLTDNMATVTKIADITSAEAFGGDCVVLLDSENLRVPDTAGTRGSKYWKSTRKIKAISQQDYSAFRGKKPAKVLEFTDSDSDFEFTPKKKCKDGDNSTNEIISRIDTLETEIKRSVIQLENQEKLIMSARALESDKKKLEEENHSIERALDSFKNGLSCIVCKSLAKFPWQITPCCHILLCSDCAGRWLGVDASCPHCRAVIDSEQLNKIEEIRPLKAIIGSESAN